MNQQIQSAFLAHSW